MKDSEVILRAAKEMKRRAEARAAAGEMAVMPPAAALRIATVLEGSGNQLAAVNERYATTDEPAAIEDALYIARAYLGGTA
ncbi:hypothetical protein [Streptomyces sp. NPDC058108]|uniref:hypothetical protein n=1 Tax=Streptomyces sp. NPDC058108 TaxID=3346344 RepID=UPI0036E72513